MKRSTPKAKMRSLFSTLPLVMTFKPLALASGIAIAPTPPVPPEIKIVLPFLTCINSKACMTVKAVKGIAAA